MYKNTFRGANLHICFFYVVYILPFCIFTLIYHPKLLFKFVILKNACALPISCLPMSSSGSCDHSTCTVCGLMDIVVPFNIGALLP